MNSGYRPCLSARHIPECRITVPAADSSLSPLRKAAEHPPCFLRAEKFAG